MISENPSVLIMKLEYRGGYHKFVMPLCSNIFPTTPKEQYFALPPNKNSKNSNNNKKHWGDFYYERINFKYITNGGFG